MLKTVQAYRIAFPIILLFQVRRKGGGGRVMQQKVDFTRLCQWLTSPAE
ncbi:hypothetical protein [Leptolyngbya sp. FACHB-711]|nr:hypothetical protein [Leptolyngbya sp. FACHB-711]MBD1850544.1 hypothetical protein [Cyanobacteria bacterium FACHB-502]MBD2026760.1 hypothetical protein [Leptolyngbya sp. FACHB-711]